MSAIEDNRMSPTARMAIALTVVVALLGATAWVGAAWVEAMRGDAAASAQDQPRIEYTRQEFALAIERAIRGK